MFHNPARLLIIGGLALILLATTFKTWRVVSIARSLQSHQAQAAVVLEGGVNQADPDEIERLIIAARQDIVALRAEVGFLTPLLPLFGWAPRVGPLLQNGPALLEMADAGSEAAVYALGGLKPGLILLQEEPGEGGSRLPEVIRLLDEAGPDLQQAALSLERVAAARAELERVDALPWRARQLLEQLDLLLPAAQDSLQLAQLLPAMTAGRQHYLILAQNEDEIRPTGGFISGVGWMVVEDGHIVSIEFEDANLVDDWRNKPYGQPPEPLRYFMASDLFLFRDANFWPDFPTSAQTALELYSYGQDLPLADGVIAIDQRFLELMLAATGPLWIPELNQTISAGNVLNEIRQAWNIQEDQTVREWFDNRKAFMGPLVAAMRHQLENNPGEVDLLLLLQNMKAAADGRHLQIYARDPLAAAGLAQIGWDGRMVRHPQQDFLAVIDANVGFNKVNAVVSSEIHYRVRLAERGGQAELQVIYHHAGPPGDGCVHGTIYDQDISYEGMFEDCFWNYQRVYVPSGSQLLEASEHPTPAESLLRGEAWPGRAQSNEDLDAFTQFDNLILLAQGESLTSRFLYRLPDDLPAAGSDGTTLYTLILRQQAGAGSQPYSVTVTLPVGSRLADVSPLPTRRHGNDLVFIGTMEGDLIIKVTYR